MNHSKNIVIKQIERYLNFLSGLQAEDITKLENGEVSIRFEIIGSKKSKLMNNNSPKLFTDEKFNAEQVIAEMRNLNSREEGENLLLMKCTLKSDFIAIAKKLDIPFEKKDSIEKIKNKIIEATIGFRLRSQAIQG